METDAVVEVAVEQVKNDFIPGSKIETGITYSVSENLAPLVEKYFG